MFTTLLDNMICIRVEDLEDLVQELVEDINKLGGQLNIIGARQ